MHFSHVRLYRLGLFLILALILVTLLAGCAGGDSKSSASDQPAANVPAGQADSPNSTDATPVAQPQSEPLAARVSGQTITLAAFERERARRMVGLDIQPATQAAFDASVLQSMIDQVLVEQYAAQNGITVTEVEVDAELAAQGAIAAANNLSLEEFVASQQYTMDEYRQALSAMLLWSKVSQTVTAVVPATADQVHARHILVADEATARQLIAQLDQGADFAQLAIQYSLDSSSARAGGDLDWVGRGDLIQLEVEKAIFALQPGQRSPEPVKSSLGYHVIEVLERVQGRPLDQAELAGKKEQAFVAWLDAQRGAAQIERYVGVVNQ